MQADTHAKRRPRRISQPAEIALADPGLHYGATAPYEPISPAVALELVEAALALMENTGVLFAPESQAIPLLREAGCKVSADGIVLFEPQLVHGKRSRPPRRARSSGIAPV